MLGWKYVHAEEDSQRYKIGKFILETKRVVKYGREWEDEDGGVDGGIGGDGEVGADGEKDVQFDSQDEDECEDLFSGLWSPELARKRRRNKAFRQ